jgi:hypothetical protein
MIPGAIVALALGALAIGCRGTPSASPILHSLDQAKDETTRHTLLKRLLRDSNSDAGPGTVLFDNWGKRTREYDSAVVQALHSYSPVVHGFRMDWHTARALVGRLRESPDLMLQVREYERTNWLTNYDPEDRIPFEDLPKWYLEVANRQGEEIGWTRLPLLVRIASMVNRPEWVVDLDLLSTDEEQGERRLSERMESAKGWLSENEPRLYFDQQLLYFRLRDVPR